MHQTLFRAWIWAIGLAHAGTLTYGLAAFPPDTITQHMIDHVEYRITISVCVLLQIITWSACVYAQHDNRRGWITGLAFLCLSATLVSWVSLTAILTTQTHLTFVYICMGSFTVFILILCYLTGPEHIWAVRALEACLFILIGAGIAMLCLFWDSRFYIPEHIGFFANAAVFTLFFTIHTYPHWSERDEAARTLASERRYTVEMISCFDDVWDAPRSQCCCDHDRGRGGEALEPLMGRGGGRVV